MNNRGGFHVRLALVTFGYRCEMVAHNKVPHTKHGQWEKHYKAIQDLVLFGTISGSAVLRLPFHRHHPSLAILLGESYLEKMSPSPLFETIVITATTRSVVLTPALIRATFSSYGEILSIQLWGAPQVTKPHITVQFASRGAAVLATQLKNRGLNVSALTKRSPLYPSYTPAAPSYVPPPPNAAPTVQIPPIIFTPRRLLPISSLSPPTRYLTHETNALVKDIPSFPPLDFNHPWQHIPIPPVRRFIAQPPSAREVMKDALCAIMAIAQAAIDSGRDSEETLAQVEAFRKEWQGRSLQKLEYMAGQEREERDVDSYIAASKERMAPLKVLGKDLATGLRRLEELRTRGEGDCEDAKRYSSIMDRDATTWRMRFTEIHSHVRILSRMRAYGSWDGESPFRMRPQPRF
ncbi:hypothetical protein BOTBODRAFT_49159 [Botryobasidium botryosum FD-172 SS1]|uniref:RRM domain-containing protein n=1 Tax=Botryobasidium botryosum (strain FD-172 SS1) TaxID=930990 RepID=A0A067M4R6_BOTB1|nr:hypothetical protein BOTBODRAFT_49159 [Botryobasidium botryosum FD-172 SS1]